MKLVDIMPIEKWVEIEQEINREFGVQNGSLGPDLKATTAEPARNESRFIGLTGRRAAVSKP